MPNRCLVCVMFLCEGLLRGFKTQWVKSWCRMNIYSPHYIPINTAWIIYQYLLTPYIVWLWWNIWMTLMEVYIWSLSELYQWWNWKKRACLGHVLPLSHGLAQCTNFLKHILCYNRKQNWNTGLHRVSLYNWISFVVADVGNSFDWLCVI